MDAALSKEISDYKSSRDYKEESAELKVKDGKVSFVSNVKKYNDPGMGNFYKTDVNSQLNIEIPEKEFKQILALAKDKNAPNISFSQDRDVAYKKVRSDVRVWRESSGLVLNVYIAGTYGVSSGVKQKRLSGTSDCFDFLIKDYMKKLGIRVSE